MHSQHTTMALCPAGTKDPARAAVETEQGHGPLLPWDIHTPPNKPLVSNAGRRKAKGRCEAYSKRMFPQKWIICALLVVWVLIRTSGITTYLTIAVNPAGRYTKHTNCIDMLKEGGKAMDNSVRGVK